MRYRVGSSRISEILLPTTRKLIRLISLLDLGKMLASGPPNITPGFIEPLRIPDLKPVPQPNQNALILNPHRLSHPVRDGNAPCAVDHNSVRTLAGKCPHCLGFPL